MRYHIRDVSYIHISVYIVSVFFQIIPRSAVMDGWLDGSAPNSAAVFLNVYIADALGSFNWSAERMDGWPGWLEFRDP